MANGSAILQVLIGVAALVVLAFLAAAYYRFLRSKYYFEREEGGKQAQRLGLVLALLLLALLGVRLAAPWLDRSLARLARGVSAIPGRMVSLRATLAPSPTRTPTRTPSPSPTFPSPEATRPSPTPLPAVASPTAIRTVATPGPTPRPLPTSVSSVRGDHFDSTVLARGIDAEKQPVDVGQVFTLDDRPVYVFFEYRNMRDGLRWSQEWVKGEDLLWRDEGRWGWGGSGRAWVFYTPPYGWTAGEYEVRLYVEGNLEQAAAFRME
ncbi:MAG: hypothetical protein ACUVXG_01580 [Anaerolineae bacterium]